MLAVSSFRPLDESDEYRATQLAAHESWRKVFNDIIYVSKVDIRLCWPTVWFIPTVDSDDYPKVKDMVAMCTKEGWAADTWSCLINADIIVSERLKAVEAELDRHGCVAAISRRYNFDPQRGPGTGNVTDLGLDFFAAKRDVWKKCLKVIPDQFRIGHCFWDTWMLGFLNTTCRRAVADITPSRCIFHPKHGGRRSRYRIDTSFKSEYLQHVGMPRLKITVANTATTV